MRLLPSLACAIAVVGNLVAQDASDVLRDLREQTIAQERSTKTIAWTATVRTTRGTGEQQVVLDDTTLRIVRETRRFGRIHVWFEPRRMHWAERDCMVEEHGEAVFDGKRSAHVHGGTSVDGQPRSRPEGGCSSRYGLAHSFVASAGAQVTAWPIVRDRTFMLSEDLQRARPEQVKLTADGIEVTLPKGPMRQGALRFRRDGERFALVEVRTVAGGKVTSTTRVLDGKWLDDVLWFPTKIVVDFETSGDRSEVVVHDVVRDPVVGANTFAIVTGPRVPFSREGAQDVAYVSSDTPELDGIVRLATDAVRAATPPTKLPSERSAEK